jgi:serine/threonine protein kinase
MEGSLQDYQLLGRLGESTQGAVYRALDLAKGREAAIKITPVDEWNRDYLHYEGLALEALSPENNCSPYFPCFYAHFFDERNGQEVYVLVMELVKGDLLQNLEAEGSPDLIWTIVGHLLRAVNELHSAHYLHNDLHEGNMIWTGEAVKLLDFGAVTSDESVENREAEIEYLQSIIASLRDEVTAGRGDRKRQILEGMEALEDLGSVEEMLQAHSEYQERIYGL